MGLFNFGKKTAAPNAGFVGFVPYIKSQRPKRLSAALYGNSPRVRTKQYHFNKRDVAVNFGMETERKVEDKEPLRMSYKFKDSLGNFITVFEAPKAEVYFCNGCGLEPRRNGSAYGEKCAQNYHAHLN